MNLIDLKILNRNILYLRKALLFFFFLGKKFYGILIELTGTHS